MRKELEKLTTKQLIKLVKTFEHYPAVTLKDGKDYILSYLEDEACTISEKEIAEYLLKSGVEITQENIHLFYEFMSKNDKKNTSNVLDGVFKLRLDKIKRKLNINSVLTNDYFEYEMNKNNQVSMTLFQIKDTLKPIDEYIKEIKDSEQYKIFTSECRCNNCMTYFASDDDLINIKDEDGKFKGCPECNTDAYLMDLTSLK